MSVATAKVTVTKADGSKFNEESGVALAKLPAMVNALDRMFGGKPFTMTITPDGRTVKAKPGAAAAAPEAPKAAGAKK